MLIPTVFAQLGWHLGQESDTLVGNTGCFKEFEGYCSCGIKVLAELSRG